MRAKAVAVLLLALCTAGVLGAHPASAAGSTCATSTQSSYGVTLCITAPTVGATVSGATPIKATVSVTGAAPAVNGITYTLDGQYLLFDPQAPYTATLHSWRYPAGTHTLTGTVAMSGGANVASVSVSFTVAASTAPAPPPAFTPRLGTAPAAGQPRVVAVAGDGASGLTAEQQVVNLMASWKPNLVFTLGDVYANGSPEEFLNWYGSNGTYYNRFFSITDPTVGNHEYTDSTGARPYFGYWGGPPHYYSFTVGTWHFISLDNTDEYGQLSTTSPQYQWLQSDLDADTSPCTAVIYHRPVFSNDQDESATDFMAYWQLLAAHHVALVLNGHSHNYQRWVPLDGNGNPSPTGVTELVAGTGGQWISRFDSSDPRMAVGFDTTADAWGALKLSLDSRGATYQFSSINGGDGDYGALSCGTDTTPPSAPSGLKAVAASGREVDLSWKASTDDSGVASYQVVRDGTVVATVRGDHTSYQDTTVAASATLHYAVRAVDASGNVSADSTTVSVTTPAPAPTYVQAATNATGSRLSSMTVRLDQPVRKGDLLVGWFGQYNASGEVQVSDPVNGAWTRVGGESYSGGSGDVGLYYVPASAAAANGLDVTVSSSSPTYLSGTASEYWGTAAAGPLASWSVARGNSTAATGPDTASAPAGSLVYAGLVTGGTPGSVTPGSSAGVPFALRAARTGGSVATEDISSSAAGAQHGAFTLGTGTDWYVGTAVFRAASNSDTTPPTAPAGVTAVAASSTSVDVGWQPATDDVGVSAYQVLRDGTALATVPDTARTFTDNSAQPGTSYSYTVEAFDAAGNHSAPSAPATVTTPASSAAYVQGATAITGSRAGSTTLSLGKPVTAGDLLVGWFGQYDATGPVQVSDDVNGAWTRVPGTTFSSGNGDIALYYKENAAAAPNGVTVTVAAASPTYLQATASEYSGVATSNSLLATAVDHGYGTAAASQPTSAPPAGSLVLAAVMTGGNPGASTPGSSGGRPLVGRTSSATGVVASADVVNSSDQPQSGSFALQSPTDWYALTATFRSAP